MKKVRIFLATVALSYAVFTMADPIMTPMPSGNHDTLMTDTPWIVLSAVSDSLFYDSVSMEWISDILLLRDACDEDDLNYFYLDSTAEIKEGLTACSTSSSEFLSPYNWYFYADNDSLALIIYGNDTIRADLLKLVSDTLRIQSKEIIGTRIYTNTVTYIPKNY